MSVIMNVLNTIKREGSLHQDAKNKGNPELNSEKQPSEKVIESNLNISPRVGDRVRIRTAAAADKGAGSSKSFFLTEVVLFKKIKTNRLMVLVALAILCFVGYFGFQFISSSVSPGGISLGGKRSSDDGQANTRQVRAGKQVLQGVVVGDEDPYCLIGGEILKIGDSWRGKEIIKIRADGVTLIDKKGEVFFLSYRK